MKINTKNSVADTCHKRVARKHRKKSATIVKGRKKLKGQQRKLLLIARAAATIHMAHNGQRERVRDTEKERETERKRGRQREVAEGYIAWQSGYIEVLFMLSSAAGETAFVAFYSKTHTHTQAYTQAHTRTHKSSIHITCMNEIWQMSFNMTT